MTVRSEGIDAFGICGSGTHGNSSWNANLKERTCTATGTQELERNVRGTQKVCSPYMPTTLDWPRRVPLLAAFLSRRPALNR